MGEFWSEYDDVGGEGEAAGSHKELEFFAQNLGFLNRLKLLGLVTPIGPEMT